MNDMRRITAKREPTVLIRPINTRTVTAKAKSEEAPKPPEPLATYPLAVGQGAGRFLWREVDHNQQQTRVLNAAWWDLCEQGTIMAQEFQKFPEWSYVSIYGGQSWLKERLAWQLDYNDPKQVALLADLVDLADIIHQNEHHGSVKLAEKHVGKRMVMHHHGVCYRDNPERYEQAETEAGYTRLISTPDLLIHGAPKYRKNLKWLPLPVNLAELRGTFPHWQERDPAQPFHVLHGYTVQSNKDPESDLPRIVSQLQRQREKVELDLYTRVPKRMSLWLISQADLYFATWLYGPGMATIEAWALGVPTMLSCTPEELAAQKRCYGEELPFCHVTKENAAAKLRELIHEPGLRAEYIKRGYQAIEKLHDVRQVVKKLQGYYEKTKPCRRIVAP